MANVSIEDWLIKLQESLTDLKLSASSLDTKLDQLTVSLSKLEVSVEDMKNITSNQETRIQLIEAQCARLPEALNEDLVLMKSKLAGYQKFLWFVVATVIGLFVKTFYDTMMM
ncbi:MAG TPA: hypothetical protein EYG21_01060 [Nitrospinaceae bacterium]|nr:hypothetical protein [Nitrospinaceae bacterium]